MLGPQVSMEAAGKRVLGEGSNLRFFFFPKQHANQPVRAQGPGTLWSGLKWAGV